MTTTAKTAAPPRPQDDEILGKAYDPKIGRRLLSYLRPYARQLLTALALMTVATAALVSGPYLIKIALDNGIAARDPNMLGRAVLVYLLGAGVFWLGTFLRVRLMAVT